MRLGSYEVAPGALFLFGFLCLVALLLLYTWLKNSRTGSELQALARQNNWEWTGSAPEDLKAALANLQDSSQKWSTSKVMVASGTVGRAFLFHYQKRLSGSTSPGSSTSKTSDGMACLVPGPVEANTAVYTIERKPLKAIETYLEFAGNPVAGAGSNKFRERFLVQSIGEAYYGNEDGAVIARIDISPALEEEMIRWHRPLGQIQAWTKVHIRSGLVLITRNWQADMPDAEWQKMLEMCEGVSRALRVRQ